MVGSMINLVHMTDGEMKVAMCMTLHVHGKVKEVNLK